MALSTDTVLGGRYRLGSLLGRGGMAEVYDAVDERLDRAVAVKVLRTDVAMDPDVRRRFEAEARAAARLSHPNVVAVFDTGEDDGIAWMVMERLPGETLADRMGRGQPDEHWIARMAGDVLGALGSAHQAGIVHRDVKPANILLGSDGCAKVADFGIAKVLEGVDDTTHTGQLIGTPAYVAPERIDGLPATPRSDLYSLGVVLYEALAGEKPFRGTTPISVAYAVRHTEPRPLTEIRPDLPAHFIAAVHRAMERDPERRFATAAEMAHALQVGLSGTEATVAAAPVDRTMVMETPALVEAREKVPVGALVPGVERRGPLHRSGRVYVAVLLAGLLSLLAVGVVLARDPTPAQALTEDLREAAGELDANDGPRAGDAARRLEQIAGNLEAATPAAAEQANSLLTDLAVWQSTGQLLSGAVSRVRALLLRVPGVDPAAFSVPTTVPPTTAAPPPPKAAKGEGKGDRKKGKDDDD